MDIIHCHRGSDPDLTVLWMQGHVKHTCCSVFVYIGKHNPVNSSAVLFFIDVLLIFLRCIFTKSLFNKHLFSVKLFSVKHVYKDCSESSWRDTVSHNMCTSYILSPFVIVSYNCCTLVPSFLQNTDSVVEKMFLVLKPAFAMHTSGGKIISNIQCCIVYHKLQFLQMY